MSNWFFRKSKILWQYIYSSIVNGRALSAMLSCFGFLIVISLCSSFFITPKAWYVQFANALFGMAGGGVAGMIVGVVIGGIGIALGGTAFGVAGWLAGVIFGSVVGGFFGLISSFISNPENYTFDSFKFVALLNFVWVKQHVG